MFNRFLSTIALVAIAAVGFAQSKSLLLRNAFLITSPNVAEDMKLSKAQIAKRTEVLARYEDKRQEVEKQLNAGIDENGATKIRAAMEEAELSAQRDLVALLNPVQQKRLKQIGIQDEGIEVLKDDAVAAELTLSAAQKTKMTQIFAGIDRASEAYDIALGDALEKIPDPGNSPEALKAYAKKQSAVIASMEPLKKKYLIAQFEGEKNILAMLTPVQKKKWQAMVGKPLKKG